MGQTIVKSVAGQLGINEKEASAAVSTAMPAILAGMTKNARSAEGAESLNKALETKHDGSLLDNLSSMLQRQAGELQRDGDGILGHVFGGKRSALEQGVARQAGISSGKAGSLLSTLAPIVMAFLASRVQSGGLDAGGLGQALGQERERAQAQGGLGGGLLGSLLDQDGDGQVGMGDLFKIGGALLGGRR